VKGASSNVGGGEKCSKRKKKKKTTHGKLGEPEFVAFPPGFPGKFQREPKKSNSNAWVKRKKTRGGRSVVWKKTGKKREKESIKKKVVLSKPTGPAQNVGGANGSNKERKRDIHQHFFWFWGGG